MSAADLSGEDHRPQTRLGRARSDWLAAVSIALIAPALRMLPNVWGYRYESADRAFTGLGFLPNDFRSYASFIAQARETGRFFFENEFTLQPQDGRYVLLFHWLTGRVSAITGLEIPPAWWIVQLAAGVALLLGARAFLGGVFTDPRERLRCLLLIAFSGGLEWVLWAVGPWLPAAVREHGQSVTWPIIGWNTFESLFAPLSTLACALSLGVLWIASRSGQTVRPVRLGVSALLILLVYATHGYTAVALAGILGATLVLGVVRRAVAGRPMPHETRSLLVLCAAFAAPFGLCLWQLADPVFASSLGRAAGAEDAYRIWLWPLTQGLVLALAGVGLPVLWRRDDAPSRLLLGWLLATALLANLPFFSPSRFLFLIHLPLCVAATIGITRLRVHGPAWTRSRVVQFVAFIALFATNAAVVPLSLAEVRDDPYRYVSRTELGVMARMQRLPRGGVLAGAVSATYLPWLARQPVYLGHWFLTPGIQQRAVLMRRFFSGAESRSWSEAFLRENGIRYVYVGPLERSLGRLDPSLPLEPVIEDRGVTVFRVRDAREASEQTTLER